MFCEGVVIEEFDTTFVNKFYHSQYDDKSNVNTTAIAAAASLLARTLVMLASDSVSTVDSPAFKSTQVTPYGLFVSGLLLCVFYTGISTAFNQFLLDCFLCDHNSYRLVLLSLLCIALVNR